MFYVILVVLLAMNTRIENYSKVIKKKYHTGFTKGKSTTDHIFTIKQFIRKIV